MKDVDLSRCLLVDNDMSNWTQRPAQGVIVLPFHLAINEEDDQLLGLARYLLCVAGAKDLPMVNAQYFAFEGVERFQDVHQAVDTMCRF